MTTIKTSTLESLAVGRGQVNAFVNGFHDIADGRELSIARTKFQEAFMFLEKAVTGLSVVDVLLSQRAETRKGLADLKARIEAIDHGRLSVELEGDVITIYAYGNSSEYAYSGDLAGAIDWYANFGRNLDRGLHLAATDENGDPICVKVPYDGAAERAAAIKELEGETELTTLDIVNPDLADLVADGVVDDAKEYLARNQKTDD